MNNFHDSKSLKNCHHSKKLLTKIKIINRTSKDKVDIAYVIKAILLIKAYHTEQITENIKPFYYCSLDIAHMLCDYCFKTDIIVTAILYEAIKAGATYEMIQKYFCAAVTSNLLELIKFNESKHSIEIDKKFNRFLKERKYGLIFIIQFEKLHKIEPLNNARLEKMQQTIKSTMITFNILAKHLNIENIEQECVYLCSELIEQMALAPLSF